MFQYRSNLSDGTAELSMCMDSSNTIVVLSLDSNGILVTHERNSTTEAGQCFKPTTSKALGPKHRWLRPHMHVAWSFVGFRCAGSLMHCIRNSTGAWSSFGGQPTSDEGGAWELVSSGGVFDDDNASDRYTSNQYHAS